MYYRDEDGEVWNKGHLIDFTSLDSRYRMWKEFIEKHCGTGVIYTQVFGIVEELFDGQLVMLDETVRPHKPSFLVGYIDNCGAKKVVLFDGRHERWFSEVNYGFVVGNRGENSTRLWRGSQVRLTTGDYMVLTKAVEKFMAEGK